MEEKTPVGKSLDKLCTNRLPASAENAVENEAEEIAKNVIEAQGDIGVAAIKQNYNRPLVLAVRGLADLIAEIEFDLPSERVRADAIDQSSELVKDAADEGMWEASGKAIRYLSWQTSQSVLARDKGDNRDIRYSSLAILCIPKVLEKLVNSSRGWLDSRIRWESTKPVGNFDSYSKARAVRETYIAMAELTSAFIQYELAFEVNLVDWTSVDHGWTSPISTLDAHNLESFQQLWVGSILYLQYVENQTSDEVMRNSDLGLLLESSASFVITTIDTILDGEIDPTQHFNFRQTVDPTDIPKTGHSFQLLPETELSFEDWLENQRQYYKARSNLTFEWGNRS